MELESFIISIALDLNVLCEKNQNKYNHKACGISELDTQHVIFLDISTASAKN